MDRAVIVTKPTRLEELVIKHLTEGAARFDLESRGQSIEFYRNEDATYKAALSEIRRQIPNDLPVTTVRREDLPNFLFRDKDLVIACGPDGLFVNLAKYVQDQPILTVNPDPQTVAGVLMRFRPNQVGELIAKVQTDKHQIEKLPFVKALIDDDRVVWAINDVFIGRRNHVSARYEIEFNGRREHHSSSGMIVSTGVGSTGWISSIINMVGQLSAVGASPLLRLPGRTSNELVFVVREPFASPGLGTNIVTGRIQPGKPLKVISEMPEGGCIFSDGVIEKAVAWNAGSTVVVSVGDRYVQQIVG